MVRLMHWCEGHKRVSCLKTRLLNISVLRSKDQFWVLSDKCLHLANLHFQLSC